MYYIGKTKNTLRQRFANHKTGIINKTRTAISSHFNEYDHTLRDLKLGIIDQTTDTTGLKYREAFWIHKMDTLDLGINRRNEREHNLSIHTTHISEHYQHSTTCTPYITKFIKEKCNKVLYRK